MQSLFFRDSHSLLDNHDRAEMDWILTSLQSRMTATLETDKTDLKS